MNRYFLALCGCVLAVFVVAGEFIHRGARDLADKATEQLAVELSSLRTATETSITGIVEELELLAGLPVMIRLLDLDVDSEISHALQSTLQVSGELSEIDCISTEGLVVASTDPRRVGVLLSTRVQERFERLADGMDASLGVESDELVALVPIDRRFDRVERLGFLRATVRRETLLPGDSRDWIALEREDGAILATAGRAPLAESGEGNSGTDELVIRSAEVRLPERIACEPLRVRIAKPFNTLFGRSIALRAKVTWIWGASAFVLALVMFTFLRLESRYERRVFLHARELEEKNTVLQTTEVELRTKSIEAEAASVAKTQFLATISHELRTPMNGVLGMTELLLDSSLESEQREWAETVSAAGNDLLLLINDILDYSRLESDTFELDVRESMTLAPIETTAARFEGMAEGRGLSLRVDVDENTPQRVRFDGPRVAQVLRILMSNAVKFTDRGSIVIRVRLKDALGDEAQLQISVQDSGIGIAADRLDHIFEPFAQAESSSSRRYGGTGMGLAVCRKIVECMGGELSCESTVGVGSCFTFSIPVQQLPSESETPAAPVGLPQRDANETAEPVSARKVLLIAEDNVVNQRLIRRLVEKLGFDCDVADNGREAVELFPNRNYAAVLMDVQMPEMDGLEATRRIRQLESELGMHTPIIAVSANSEDEDRRMGFDAGMDEYLGKPIDRASLGAALEEFVAS